MDDLPSPLSFLPPIPAQTASVWGKVASGDVEPHKPVEPAKGPPNTIHITPPESLSTTSLNTGSPSKSATQKELPPWASLPLDECMEFYAEALREAAAGGQAEYDSKRRLLAENDLFYLLVFICERKDLIHPWLYARCREVQANPDGYLDLWAREHYKAVDVNEPVPTPTGFKSHGDLKPGDWVFGGDGNPIQVIARTPIFTDADCFRVTFDDGYSVVVSGEHLWTVERRTRKRAPSGRMYRESVTMDTRSMASHNHRADNRLSVPVAPPVMQIEHMLPIEPYTLGCWLGDGCCDVNVLTCGDDEVFQEIEKHYKVSKGRPSKAITRTIHGIMPILRDMGLLSNKHIPRDYLVASVKQRRAMLQGLMDTDGTCNSRGTATFVNKNEVLAGQVFELAASLGLKPRFNTFTPPHGKVYYVSFQAYQDDELFRIQRKLARCKPGKRKNPRRFITSVEPVPSIPVSCIQVAAEDGLYLIGRNHVTTHNSTVITFGLTVLDIINDPEVTIGIFSHTKPIAKGFLRQIKYEFESRPVFYELWPDIFWESPKKDSPKWSEDEGITVKRKSNPKEATVEAWGLVDGQPTGKHYKKRVYDDVVTDKSVYTPEQIQRTTSAWELSDNLGAKDGAERYIGTRYNLFDTYNEMMKREVVKVRLYPATKDGMETGDPVLLTREALAVKRAKQGPYTFGAQMLQNPVADSAMGFKDAWLVYEQFTMDGAMTALNRIIVVDPAGSKKRKNNDYTTMWVLGLGSDSRWRVLEFIRDRLNLTQRAAALIALHKRWKPLKVGYEEYGMQADIEHIKSVQVSSLYQFGITPLGGQMSKHNRIMRLVPYFENGNIIMPPSMVYKDYQGVVHDLVRVFREEEYIAYPVPNHDDMLDGLSRLCDEAMRIDPPIENNTLVSQGLNLEDALHQASIQIGMTGTSSVGALDMGSSWMGA